jgi:hypothetical protein
VPKQKLGPQLVSIYSTIAVKSQDDPRFHPAWRVYTRFICEIHLKQSVANWTHQSSIMVSLPGFLTLVCAIIVPLARGQSWSTIPPIEVYGQHFFYTNNGSQL